ncbi:hypothetical protein McanMca71_004118 [Microsporum canis]
MGSGTTEQTEGRNYLVFDAAEMRFHGQSVSGSGTRPDEFDALGVPLLGQVLCTAYALPVDGATEYANLVHCGSGWQSGHQTG